MTASKNSVCHRQKNFNSLSVCDENKSPRRSALQTETSVNFPPENSLCSASEGVRLTRRTRGNTLIKHLCHHHDVYRHASLGAGAPAFCMNSQQFVYKAELLWFSIGGDLANRGWGFYASSPVWMGLVCWPHQSTIETGEDDELLGKRDTGCPY